MGCRVQSHDKLSPQLLVSAKIGLMHSYSVFTLQPFNDKAKQTHIPFDAQHIAMGVVQVKC